MTPIPVYLETGAKLVFASAVAWPGWSRKGKTAEEALDRLADYGSRYRAVAALAGLSFPASVAPAAFEVVERLTGDGATDFGVPSVVSTADAGAHTRPQAERIASLLQASWDYLDDVIAGAPASLRKGPRGGGRDRDQIHDHVVGAEFEAYARKIGIKVKPPGITDRAGIEAGHATIIEAVSRPSDDVLPEGMKWPTAYMARRAAWHALDHAWEIEDRSG